MSGNIESKLNIFGDFNVYLGFTNECPVCGTNPTLSEGNDSLMWVSEQFVEQNINLPTTELTNQSVPNHMIEKEKTNQKNIEEKKKPIRMTIAKRDKTINELEMEEKKNKAEIDNLKAQMEAKIQANSTIKGKRI